MCVVSLDLFPTISLTRSQPRRGAVLSDAEPALVALADRVGALLATSVCGHGLFSKTLGRTRFTAMRGRRRRRCWRKLDGRGMTSPKGGRRSDTMRERIRAGDNHHFSHPDELNTQFIDPRTLSKAVDAMPQVRYREWIGSFCVQRHQPAQVPQSAEPGASHRAARQWHGW